MNESRPSELHTRETIALLLRSLRYVEPFRWRFFVKLLIGILSLIPLIVTPETSPLPVLDSTRLLARAALRAALE